MANRHRKKDRFICVLCVIMAIVILATAFLLVMELATPYKVSKGFKKEAQASGGLAVEEITEGNGITLTSYAVQAQADGKTGDALTIDETHKVIEATVKLSDGTTSSNVKWTLAPKEGETWYEDKAVSDYVELKAASKDNAGAYTLDGLVAYTGQQVEAICIESKQAFGGVLEVVATSADDETKSATVEVNYYKSVSAVNVKATSDAANLVYQNSGVWILGEEEYDSKCASNRFEITPTYGVGTIEGTFEIVSAQITYSLNSSSFFGVQASTLINNLQTINTAWSNTEGVKMGTTALRVVDGTVYVWYQDLFLFSGGRPWSAVSEEYQQLMRDGFVESQTKCKTQYTGTNGSSLPASAYVNVTLKYVTEETETEFTKTNIMFRYFETNYTAAAAE